MFRALAVLRIVVLVNAVALNIYRADEFSRPTAAAVCVVVMIAWTAFATWAYADKRRRRLPLLVADLAMAVALLLVTPWVKEPEFTSSLPGFWILGALFAWAIHYRLVGGLVAGVLLAAADLQRQDIDASDYGNAFLLIMGGTIVGFMCDSLQQMATERDVAERSAAMAAERARLARVVHDGVLQVLALVQRRGRELGGEAAELGRLAGEQEQELRRLIHAQDASHRRSGRDGRPGRRADTAGAGPERHGVDARVPGRAPGRDRPRAGGRGPCLPRQRAAPRGRGSAGMGAPGGVPGPGRADVRDDGPGIPAGRIEEAAAQGRLGVTEAIRGRIADLGGTAELATGTFGTEWEFVVPRVAPTVS